LTVWEKHRSTCFRIVPCNNGITPSSRKRQFQEIINLFLKAKFKNYLIFYQPTSEKLEIVRVLHSARDIPSLFGEQVTENGQEQRAA
jgi:ParE toxin of type II toxin-antitoxin system, parDE